MAEEGGGFPKSLDLYIGVVDFFAILLPGSMLTFLAGLCISWSSPFLSPVNRALSERFARYAAFAVVSYVLGHFLSAMGSTALDHVYDRWYKKHLGHKLDLRRDQVKPILARVLGTASSDNALDWTFAVLKVRAPGAFTQLDRLDADSKLFRSMTVVLLIAWPLLLYLRQGYWSPEGAIAFWLVLAFLVLQAIDKPLHEEIRVHSKTAERLHAALQWTPVVWTVAVTAILPASLLVKGLREFVGIGVSCCVVALISAERYMTLRIRRTQRAYELVIVLLDSRSDSDAEENRPASGGVALA